VGSGSSMQYVIFSRPGSHTAICEMDCIARKDVIQVKKRRMLEKIRLHDKQSWEEMGSRKR